MRASKFFSLRHLRALLGAGLSLSFSASAAIAQQAASQNAADHPLGHDPAAHEIYFGSVLIDQAEYRGNGRGDAVWAFQGLGRYGTDYNKVQLNARLESNQGARGLERSEADLLYSRLFSYYWDFQAGIRQDFRIDPRTGTPSRTYAMVGFQGLAPGLFEVDVHAFIGERGVPLLRAEASYDVYVTQRLVLQPEMELNFAAGRDEQALISPGLYRMETGLRLRYEFTREAAPYIGVNYERAVGGSSGLTRRIGEKPNAATFLAGIRFFF